MQTFMPDNYAIQAAAGHDYAGFYRRELAERRKLGYPYWSISCYLKEKVKRAVEFITNFQLALTQEAHRRGLDGVVCGHIHRAEIKNVDGILYCNCGDWVESCTALVEHWDGRLEIVEWARAGEPAKVAPPPEPAGVMP